MIKPSHYDDDGYPIQWFRSDIPSNTLAAVNGLALDSMRRKVLGPDVEIRLATYDETNIRIRPDKIIARYSRQRRAGADRLCRRPVEPVSARRRSCAALHRRRPAGGDRRLSRFGLPRDAAGTARRDRAAAGARCLDFRRRGRGIAARRGVARCLCGRAEAPLQLHEGSAVDRGPAAAVPVRRHGAGAPRAGDRASISAAAARSNARSAPSSMCRAARAASARPTISK